MTVFFDFDGTLVDVNAKYYSIYSQFVKRHSGLCLSKEEYWILKRAMVDNATICVKSNLDATLGDELKKNTKDYIEKDEFLEHDVLFNDTIEILNYLASKGVEINIISMRRNGAALKKQVSKLNLDKYINLIYVPHDILGKEIIEGDQLSKFHAVRALDLNFDKAILVGDTGTDISSAKELGWMSVTVLTGLRNRDNLEKYKPDFIIEKLSDIKAII